MKYVRITMEDREPIVNAFAVGERTINNAIQMLHEIVANIEPFEQAALPFREAMCALAVAKDKIVMPKHRTTAAGETVDNAKPSSDRSTETVAGVQ